MVFINELIPETEKNSLKFYVKTYPDGTKPTLYKWTIDREREAFLVHTCSWGGPYEGTQITKHFVLSWKGELIHISADPLPTIYTEKGPAMSWRVHRLDFPSKLDQKETVFQLVREAFTCMGESFDGDQFVNVSVEFDNITKG